MLTRCRGPGCSHITAEVAVGGCLTLDAGCHVMSGLVVSLHCACELLCHHNRQLLHPNPSLISASMLYHATDSQHVIKQ